MNKKIDWPSERVPQGGMFHPAKVSYSKDTHDLIKLLMDEQKMTIFQRDKLKNYLRNGDPLPIPKIIPPKLTVQQQYENQLASQIIARANSARKRTLDEIKASGAFEQEKFVPLKHLRDPSRIQKLRLQEFMSGMKHHPELDGVKIKNVHKYKPRDSRIEFDPIKSLRANEGDAYPFGALPVNTQIHCLEKNPGHPFHYITAAGTYGTILRKFGEYVVVQIPSKKEFAFHQTCMATVGRVSNIDHNKIPVGSATRKRELGYRPTYGLWQRKTGRHGRKFRRLPPMRIVAGPPKPEPEVIKLTETSLALRYNNY